MPLVSRREYARLRGVSEKAIRKAIASGKIPLVGDLIDVEQADSSWARNRDAGQQSKLAEGIASVVQSSATEPPAAVSVAVPAALKPPAAEFELAPLTEARIEQVKVATAIKEITKRKLERDLVEAEEVDRTWGEMLQVLKDRLRLMPDDDELVGALLRCKEEAEIRSLLIRSVRKVLEAMAKGIEGMVAA